MTRSEFDVVHGYLVDVANCSQCKYARRVSGSIMHCRKIASMLGIEDELAEDAWVYGDSACNLYIHWRS
jgi:hypothetical protein